MTYEDTVVYSSNTLCARLSELAELIHESNEDAGWWNDLGTGESLKVENRAKEGGKVF